MSVLSGLSRIFGFEFTLHLEVTRFINFISKSWKRNLVTVQPCPLTCTNNNDTGRLLVALSNNYPSSCQFLSLFSRHALLSYLEGFKDLLVKGGRVASYFLLDLTNCFRSVRRRAGNPALLDTVVFRVWGNKSANLKAILCWVGGWMDGLNVVSH